MEIMEDGNLLDRVRILLQRDMQYYQEKQTVLRESLCIRVSGGKLDFPRHASFAAIKMVQWWEDDFFGAFKCASGLSSLEKGVTFADDKDVKNTPPSEFLLMIVETSQQLLEHLHTLIQESLDHADLTVLTATLGAAALIRNCLWCYHLRTRDKVQRSFGDKLYKSYKCYNEMTEAVAERLLDLHCRLISLYILNEADSLSWQNDKPFFERERSSYVIQMWWLYMQGVKADLWETVSPKMAKRIFTGMLNESLSIMVARFIHGRPSLERSKQFWSDAYNVLCCSEYLVLSGCKDVEELLGKRPNQVPIAIRDIHAKCNELLVCLLLRGTPIKGIFQIFRGGLRDPVVCQRLEDTIPWLKLCSRHLLGSTMGTKLEPLVLEINILKAQPQPNWPQVIKILSMNDSAVAKLLMKRLMLQYMSIRRETTARESKDFCSGGNCGGFLCTGVACYSASRVTIASNLFSLTYVLTGTELDFTNVLVEAIKVDSEWFNYLDRHQVWNQSKPAWLNALLTPLSQMTMSIVEALLNAVKTGASIYQAMSLALACMTELECCVPLGVARLSLALEDCLPAHCHPMGNSVLLQLMCASLYSALLSRTGTAGNDEPKTPTNSEDSCCTTLAEAVCTIDQDNKHTMQIEELLAIVTSRVKAESPQGAFLRDATCVLEICADQLAFNDVGRKSLKIAYEYLVTTSDLVLGHLRGDDANAQLQKPLTYIMFHIGDTPFDQFLTNYEQLNWHQLALSTPLGISPERIKKEILSRAEFKGDPQLPLDQKEVISSIRTACSSMTCFE